MYTRTIRLGVAFLIVLTLAGCNGANDDSPAGRPVPRIGLMHVGTDHVPPSLDTLKARLEKLGWNDGRNVELTFRNLEPDAADEQARIFVHQRVDVIVAFEDQSISAAQGATARTRNPIPVVFLHPSDPVRDGLVESLSRPRSNLTGIYGPRDIVAKQLELYQLLVPRLRRVMTVIDPKDPATERLLPAYRAAAARLARPLELDIREASTAEDLSRIFTALGPGQGDRGAFLLSPSLRLNHSSLMLRLAERARIPFPVHLKEWVERGALFSYGIDVGPIGRAGARYVDAVLRGTSPADLAVEEVPTVELTINLRTAARLGIKVPQDMIIRADEVYR